MTTSTVYAGVHVKNKLSDFYPVHNIDMEQDVAYLKKIIAEQLQLQFDANELGMYIVIYYICVYTFSIRNNANSLCAIQYRYMLFGQAAQRRLQAFKHNETKRYCSLFP